MSRFINPVTGHMAMSESNNLIHHHSSFKHFKEKGLTYSVSSREMTQDIDIIDYLKIYYIYCNLDQIESVFGNTILPSRLYGGRAPNDQYALNDNHLARLSDHGIHLALTLTNHYFDEQAYKETLPLLEKHHKAGNSIICNNDNLALRLKLDFPLYELKASIIKNINTLEKIKRALDLYHSLTLPMDKNDDDDFLNSINDKHRIILFANASCAYTCPDRTCYLGISQTAFGKPVTSSCSKGRIPRLDKGKVYFDVKKFSEMGFTRFKLVPLAPKGSLEACRKLSWKKSYLINTIKKVKKVHYLCSYPKCGRTWLRYIMAHYFNIQQNLGVDIDLHSFFSLMPNDDNDPLKGIMTYRYQADTRFPIVLASHNKYSEEQFGTTQDSRIVFIFRSIPDVVVSDYFHCTRHMKWFSGSITDFLHHSKAGLRRYCHYLNSWAPVVLSGRTHVLTYEELHQDTEKTVVDLLTYLSIPVDKNNLEKAVALSTFEKMKTIEEKKGMPLHVSDSEDPEGFRVRKGKVGGSAEYLNNDNLNYIRQTCETLLTDSAKELLRRHKLWE